MPKAIILFAVAICGFGVSQARAGLLITWVGGHPPTISDPNVTTTTTSVGQYSFSATQNVSRGASVTALNGDSLTITLTVAPGYQITGFSVSATMTLNAYLSSITVNHQSGIMSGQTTTIALPDLVAGTETFQFTLGDGVSDRTGDHVRRVKFNAVSFAGTVEPVPEPINAALAGFGVILVGGAAGRWGFRRAAGPRPPAA